MIQEHLMCMQMHAAKETESESLRVRIQTAKIPPVHHHCIDIAAMASVDRAVTDFGGTAV